MVKTLEVVLNVDAYPLYICDSLGRGRTGAVLGCLRKLQRWNLTSILGEYRRFAGDVVLPLNEQFIELFDVDLVNVPSDAPQWLWRD